MTMHNPLESHTAATLRQERFFLLIIVSAAILLFLFYSLAWPMAPGRVYVNYLEHYHGYLTFDTFARSPGASYMLGWISQLSLPWIEFSFLVMYLTHLLTVYYTARLFGVLVAQIVIIILLFHFSIMDLFHKLGYAPLLSLALSIWSATIVHFFKTRSYRTLFFLGLLTASLMLIRQTPIIFIMTAAFPLVCFGISKQNWMRSAMIGIGFMVGLFALLVYNYITFNVFKLSSSLGVQFPTVHVLFYAPGLSDSYGPKNKRLLTLLQENVLSKDAYVQKNITLDAFNNNTLKNMQQYTDLVFLNHEYPGVLIDAVHESIQAQPWRFIKSLFTMTWNMYGTNPTLWPPSPPTKDRSQDKEVNPSRQNATKVDYPERDKSHLTDIMIDKNFRKTVKIPDEEDPIRAEINKTVAKFKKDGNYHVSFVIISFLTNIVPPMLFFLLASFLLIFKIRSIEVRLLLTMLIPVILINFGSGVLGQQMTDLRVPFDFLIILGGVLGLQLRRTYRSSPP
ncbi:MAG: hypothetical protein HQL76_17340 [Magnetococcales bacterium]|nr:hypothetical protein [Magnetococcales bacterium]